MVNQNKEHLRNPQKVEINGQEYTLYSIPAVPAQDILMGAIEIFKNKDFKNLSSSVTYKILAYVEHNGLLLNIPPLVDAHIPDLETILTLQMEMLKKNFDFLQNERFQKRLETLNSLIPD